ncbi:hypothetical protein [Natrononativus amylolyticus]|uniref:hypothetical protein n=1 Tax=Natrononativus amylolyticus TaxID=2963434 RepID=UPI0020CCF42E|nr:hypothetical protein [Natrononativus amylolyticus]
MYLTFVDLQDVEGTIAPDWSIEYDGASGNAIESLVDDLRDDVDASSRDLQDLSVALFTECPLKKIEIVDGSSDGR